MGTSPLAAAGDSRRSPGSLSAARFLSMCSRVRRTISSASTANSSLPPKRSSHSSDRMPETRVGELDRVAHTHDDVRAGTDGIGGDGQRLLAHPFGGNAHGRDVADVFAQPALGRHLAQHGEDAAVVHAGAQCSTGGMPMASQTSRRPGPTFSGSRAVEPFR